MKFLCENCKAKYQIADEKVAGRSVRMKCRKCGHLIEIRSSVTETSATLVFSANLLRAGGDGPSSVALPAAHGVTESPTRASAVASVSPQSLAARSGGVRPGGAGAPLRGNDPAPTGTVVHNGGLASAFQQAVAEAKASEPASSAGGEWFVGIGGSPIGPIGLDELRARASAGEVLEESLVWREGFGEWLPIGSVPELRDVARIVRADRAPLSSRAGALVGRLGLGPKSVRSSPGSVPAGQVHETLALSPGAMPLVLPGLVGRANAAAGAPPSVAARGPAGAGAPSTAAPSAPLSPPAAAPPNQQQQQQPPYGAPDPNLGAPGQGMGMPMQAPMGGMGAPNMGAYGGGMGMPMQQQPMAAPMQQPMMYAQPQQPYGMPAAPPGYGMPPPQGYAPATGFAPVVSSPPPRKKGIPLAGWFAVAAALGTGVAVGAMVFRSGDDNTKLDVSTSGGEAGSGDTATESAGSGTTETAGGGGSETAGGGGSETAGAAGAAEGAGAAGAAESAGAAGAAESAGAAGAAESAGAAGAAESAGAAGAAESAGAAGAAAENAAGAAAVAAVTPRPHQGAHHGGARRPPPSKPETTAVTPVSVPGITGTPAGPTVAGPSKGPSGGGGGGQLTSEQVQGVVNNGRAAIRRACWEPALAAKGGGATSTRVTVSISIGANGKVQSATASGGDNFPSLGGCIASRVRSWLFPSSAGVTQTTATFNFAAQ